MRDLFDIYLLREGLDETANIFNPLRVFVQEALQKRKASFLGLRPKGEKERRGFASRQMLYPTYIDFQYKRGLSHNVSHNSFTTLLMSACDGLGIHVEK